MIKANLSEVSLDDIAHIDQIELARRYLGISKMPIVISSPFREDKHPSFSIRYKNGVVQFIDFATNDYGNIYTLLCKMWNCSFKEAISKIYYDYACNNYSKINGFKKPIIDKESIFQSQIDVKVRAFEDYDLEFWGKYGISKEWLVFGDVYAISHIFIKKGDKEYSFLADKYAYVYIERKDNIVSKKIYQPYNDRYKWINKSDASVWDLFAKLPFYGDKLIITSSRKDALNIWSNLAIPATSLQGEGFIPKEKVINELKHRFKKIYVLYDNDEAGIINSKKICDKYDLENIMIPLEESSKDPSDLYKNTGERNYLSVFKKILNI